MFFSPLSKPISETNGTIGVISDTHGLLRDEASAALCGCDLIVHAGDIGGIAVVERLAAVAPVYAVRGNVDGGAWARRFPETDVVVCFSRYFYVLHDLAELDIDPAASGFAAVVSGHSHQAKIAMNAGVLYVNPGSAGPRRFSLPVSVGKINVSENGMHAEIIELAV
jgi:putative phosphoesterase